MEKSKDRTEKVNITCRMAGERVALLDKLGAHYDRDRSYLVNQAVEGFLSMHEWQIAEIEKALKEAEAGDFATDAEVRETFRKLRKMKVRWLKQGNASLALVEHYIAAENPAAGRRIVDQIEASVQRLSQFPLLGRSGVVAGTRELVVPGTEYLVVYLIREPEVLILRVFHCKQLIQ